MTNGFNEMQGAGNHSAQPSANALEWRARRERKAQERVQRKEANKAISIANRQMKKEARAKRAIIGVSKALLKQLVSQHRGDIKTQVNRFMEESKMPAAVGRKREVSDKSRSDFGKNLLNATILLKEIDMPIQNLSEFSAKHVIELVVYWKGEGHVAGTIQTRVSNFRKFFDLIGKSDTLPGATEFYKMLAKKGIDAGSLRRTLAATESKAWSHRGIDFAEVYPGIREEDELVACQLLLERLYGLRTDEAVHIKPNHNPSVDGLWVIDGAKGGLSRFVATSSDPEKAAQQRAALEEAKVLAARHPRGLLIRKGQTMRQAKTRFYTVMRKLGVTKSQLGVTAHGLRHEYANDLYEEKSGLRPPVEGVHTAQEYEDRLDKVVEAERAVSQAMGHARRSISGAYNGSRHQLAGSKMTHVARMLLKNVVLILEQDKVASVFREYAVDMAWLTGKIAMGDPLHGDQYMEITVRMKIEDDGYEGMVQRFEALEKRLNHELRREVVLKNWPKKSDPDPAKEGFVRVFGW